MEATPEAINLLREQISRFIKMSDEDWALLLPHLSEKRIKRHGYMVREGELAKDVGLVISGSMRHYYMKDGEEKTTYFYFEPAFVSSYISCMTGAPSQLTIQALDDTRLIVFPYKALKQLFEQSHAWERFGRLIAEYLAIGLEDRMVGLLTLSPEERYQQLLGSNKIKILERIPQHYIANYLGITPVSLSRIRNRIIKK